MKKILVIILSCVSILAKANECKIPEEQNYIQISFAILYNNQKNIMNLTREYCFDFFRNKKFGNSPLMQSNNHHQFIELMHLVNENDLNTKSASGFGENLLVSRMLLPTMSQKTQKEMYKEIDSIKSQYGYLTPLPQFNLEENNKIINFLASHYHKSLSNYSDIYGNTPLYYAILTNRPELLDIILSETEGKSSFYRPNKENITPLHLLFSPDVKMYDMRKMNDEILKRVDINKLIGVLYSNVDFFQFVKIMKDNNLDLYKKLVQKYKFETNITPDLINTINQMKLNYIKRVNLTYEQNR